MMKMTTEAEEQMEEIYLRRAISAGYASSDK